MIISHVLYFHVDNRARAVDALLPTAEKYWQKMPPKQENIFYRFKTASSETFSQKWEKKEEAVLHLPLGLVLLFRSDTDDEEFNGF